MLFKEIIATEWTDILGAVYIAERVFAKYEGEKILVVMSDMVHESSQYNFKKNVPKGEDVERIISEEREERGLPNLENVKVYVVGAFADDTDKMIALRRFWSSYFSSCGAVLKDFGHTLMDFEK
jgi:hypothetical protein